jgi:hypothetical protein
VRLDCYLLSFAGLPMIFGTCSCKHSWLANQTTAPIAREAI